MIVNDNLYLGRSIEHIQKLTIAIEHIDLFCFTGTRKVAIRELICVAEMPRLRLDNSIFRVHHMIRDGILNALRNFQAARLFLSLLFRFHILTTSKNLIQMI